MLFFFYYHLTKSQEIDKFINYFIHNFSNNGLKEECNKCKYLITCNKICFHKRKNLVFL